MMLTFPWTRAALLTMAAVVLEPVAEGHKAPRSPWSARHSDILTSRKCGGWRAPHQSGGRNLTMVTVLA